MIALPTLRRLTMSASHSTKDDLLSKESIKGMIQNKEWDTIEALLKDQSIPSRQKENAICLQNDAGSNSVMGALELEATFEVIKLMVDYSPYIVASKESNGWNLLHCACYYNSSPEIVQFIIDKAPPEIWSKNESGMNPLHLACRHNISVEVAKIIIHEAPRYFCASRDAEGCNALHLALRMNAAVDLIELLIVKSSRETFFARNNDGYGPLHYLCEYSEPEKVVQLIIRRETPSVILQAFENDSNLLQFASRDLLADDLFAKFAVERNPSALEFASENVKGDLPTVLKAVKKDGNMLQFATEQLRKNKDCELAAVQCTPLALAFTSVVTQETKSVVLEALERDGNALQFASNGLRKNKDIILAAVRTTPSSLRFALGGMNRDRKCLLATGLWNAMPAASLTLPTIVMSCRFSLNKHCNYHSTLFGIFMKENAFFNQFGIYHQNPWSISSCGPELANSTWPCRGTRDTCKMMHDINEKPQENECCWRHNIRCRLEKAKADGGMVIQVSEWVSSARNHLLGPGQDIETEMAAEIGVKIFRVMQNQHADRNPVQFDQQHVTQVERKILIWHRSGRRDMTISKIYVV